MFSNLPEFYAFVDTIIDKLHQGGDLSWEAKLREAMASGFTWGEVLGKLRVQFRELQRSETLQALHLESDVSTALTYLDDVLGRR